MEEVFSDKGYENEFKNPLWHLIEKYAREKDISYLMAAVKIVPEYAKNIRYRDMEYENFEVEKRAKEMAELTKREKNK